MRPIFISYRRDDTEGQAGRLFEHLRGVFGAENVFMDVATLEPGVDFRRAIEKSTASCGVLLALIGRNWLTIADSQGQRRLDDPNDFVRLETATALKRDIPVVPVLVQDAPMPRAEQLPADLRDLAFRNSVELTHARWDSDVELLTKALRKLLARDAEAAAPAAGTEAPRDAPSSPASLLPGTQPPRPPVPSRSPRMWPMVGAAAVLVAAAGGWLALRSPDATVEPVAPAASARPVTGAASATAPIAPPAPLASAAAVADDDAAKKAEEARRAEEASKAAEQRRIDRQRRAEAQREAEAQRVADEQRKADEARKAEEQRFAEEQRKADELKAEEQRRADELRLSEATRAAAAKRAEQRRQAQIAAHNNGICSDGFVWRDAGPGDKVCVTPDVRARSAAENAAAATTRSPTDRSYGPNTCKQGYVWREAYPGDVVCVVPPSRQQAANDRAQSAQRVVPPPP